MAEGDSMTEQIELAHCVLTGATPALRMALTSDLRRAPKWADLRLFGLGHPRYCLKSSVGHVRRREA